MFKDNYKNTILDFNHIQYFLNLDQFHCVHDLQKKWNLVYILILA